MQLIYRPTAPVYARGLFLLGVVLAPLAVAAGCIDRPTTLDAPPDRPHAGATLTVAVADPADREPVRQLARAWAVRSGASVTVTDAVFDGTTDVGLIPPAEVARWADTGKLAAVPAALQGPTHPYKWTDLFPVYPTRVLNWRGTAYALPVAAEALVLVYRTDVFDEKTVPRTWDDLLAAAQMLGPDSLPPVPASADVRGAEFFTAAAAYDRVAVSRLNPGELIRDEFFAFQFDAATARPRLTAPAFRHAADVVAKMAPFRGTGDAGPAAAFRGGRAKVGVMTLADLGQVGGAMADRLGVAPLPGASFVFDRDGARRVLDQQTVNRVPYVGWGGRVGVVAADARTAAAAWDFLTDLGLPEGTALDLIASPAWGAGPYRTSQVDVRARARWAGYDLSAAETERLTTALRDNVGPGVQNYRLRLRTPNQAAFAAALDASLDPLMRGTKPPAAAMTEADAQWQGIVDQLPAAEWKAAYRRSLGL